MKILQRDLSIVLISLILVAIALVTGNTIIGLAATVLIAGMAFMNKQAGIILLIIFIPVRPFLIELNPSLKLLGDLIIGLLLIKTFIDNRKQIKSLFQFEKFELFFFAFLIIGTISAFLTGVDIKAIITQIRTYALFYIVYYIVKRMDFNEKHIKTFASTTFIVAVVLSIHGIVEKLFNKTVLLPQAWIDSYWWLSWTNYIRVYGLMKGPNEFSLYLVIAFITSLYLLKFMDGKNKYMIYSGLTLIATVFLLTYSRGTMLSILVFLPIYILLTRKIKPLIPLVVIVGIAIVLFAGFGKYSDYHYATYVDPETVDEPVNEDEPDSSGKPASNRYKDTFSEEFRDLSSSTGRLYYVEKSVEIFKDHPVIGTGFGTFGGAATLAYSSPIYEEYGIDWEFYSDNQYILLLTETGIVGVLAIVLIGISIILFIWPFRKGNTVSPLLLYLIIGIVTGGLVYNILENDTFMLYFFIVLGYIYHQHSKHKEAL